MDNQDDLRNFSWLIDGEVAGMARPYIPPYDPNRPQSGDVRILKDIGIRALIGLTEHGPDHETVRNYEFDYLWIPVPDMTSPTMEELDLAVSFIDEARRNSTPMAVFCGAGYGRTGTVLSAYLVSLGKEPGEAIAEVRRKRPGSVETAEQEQAVAEYLFWLQENQKRRRNSAD